MSVNHLRRQAQSDAEFAHLKTSPDVRFADYVVSGQGADDTVDGMSKIRRTPMP